MEKWPGVGDRIVQRLREIKGGLYWNAKRGRPDVLQFCLDHRYTAQFVYKWLSGVTPDRENLERLGKDLDVHPAWLLFGVEVDKAHTNPRKRGARKVGCLVAALLTWGPGPSPASATTTIMVPLRDGILNSCNHWSESLLSEVRSRFWTWWGRAFPDLRAAWAA